MLSILRKGKNIQITGTQTGMCIFDPHYKLSVYDKKELFKKKNPEYSLKNDNMKQFLENQFKEDVFLLVKPKEVVFIGNGNVGKSSLINSVLDYESCRVSKNGGCTKYFNLYSIGSNQQRIVDSPSYSNFASSGKCRNRFKKMLKNYLTFSTRLCKIFFVLDLSKNLTLDDQVTFNYIKNLNLPIQLVFNKVEKVHSDLVYQRLIALSHPFKIYSDIVSQKIILTSCKTQFGIEQLKRAVKQSFLESPQRRIFFKSGKVIYLPEEEYDFEEKKRFKNLLEYQKKEIFDSQKNFKLLTEQIIYQIQNYNFFEMFRWILLIFILNAEIQTKIISSKFLIKKKRRRLALKLLQVLKTPEARKMLDIKQVLVFLVVGIALFLGYHIGKKLYYMISPPIYKLINQVKASMNTGMKKKKKEDPQDVQFDIEHRKILEQLKFAQENSQKAKQGVERKYQKIVNYFEYFESFLEDFENMKKLIEQKEFASLKTKEQIEQKNFMEKIEKEIDIDEVQQLEEKNKELLEQEQQRLEEDIKSENNNHIINELTNFQKKLDIISGNKSQKTKFLMEKFDQKYNRLNNLFDNKRNNKIFEDVQKWKFGQFNLLQLIIMNFFVKDVKNKFQKKKLNEEDIENLILELKQ